MKKVTVRIEERLSYTSEVIIEIPDDLDEKQFNSILDKVEREAESADDVAYLLENRGFKILEKTESFPHSPNDSEVEITDYDIE